MGAGSSKNKGKVLTNVPPPSVPPEPPYPGPPVEYQFLNTQVTIGTTVTFNFLTAPMVTSNIDQYYPVLAAPYAQGFRLLSFYQIPGQMQRHGLFSTQASLGYQGFFCRYPTAPSRENFQLRIEKSVIQLQNRFSGMITLGTAVESDTSHIVSSIARNTQDGGRLICIEMTGTHGGHSFGQAMRGLSPLMGVDVFFEVPLTPTTERYVYTCVSVPIGVATSGIGSVRSICDWSGNLGTYLNQGWRLVEIFMDKATQHKAFSTRAQMNSVWYFEKPQSRLNDSTPMYQGTIVDHEIEIKGGFTSTSALTNWEPVIQEMGNKGWELACVLELPEVRMSGFAKAIMSCKLFFQRPILPQQVMPAPSYSSVPASGDYQVAPPPEKMGY